MSFTLIGRGTVANDQTGDPARTAADKINAALAAANAGQLSGFRNLYVNGALGLWQRGASGGAAPAYTADRWRMDLGTSWARSTDVPTGPPIFPFSLEYANSGAAFASVGQRIEGERVAPHVGRRIALSFWAKSVVSTQILVGNLERANALDNWSGATLVQQIQAHAALPSTWAFYELFYNALPAEAANGIQIRIVRGNGAANTTRIAGIQLEVCDTTDPKSTPFEFRPEGPELALSQRYYEKSFSLGTAPAQNAGVGTAETVFPALQAGATAQRTQVRFQTRKRGAPTITLFNPAAANAQVRDKTAGADCSASAAANPTTGGFDLTATGNASTAIANALGIHWTADSEL